MSLFKKITESGTASISNLQQRRSILLSNYLSLLISFACFLLIVVIPGNHNRAAFFEMLLQVFIFSLPIVLNYWSFTNLSRLYLCWLPSILIMWSMIDSMKTMNPIPISMYDGLRFYLLAFSCIPYLLLDRGNMWLFVAGILPGFICIVFCDYFLDLAGVGYQIKGVVDSGYLLTPVRVLVSYVIISGSGISLNLIISNSDRANQTLLQELSTKNKLIQEQAENEVHQLNQQLYANLQDLNEREFILNQSQRIAKIGSWEYRMEGPFIFWSEEMYNIFGLDRDFDLKAKNLLDILWGEYSEVLREANATLLKTAQPYDFTLRTITPLGYTKWVRTYSFPIMKDGHVAGIRGICHDITLFKESEELLRTSEKKYKSLFEQASDFIMVVDFQGKFIDVNESSCKGFGYSKLELSGMRIQDLLDPDQLKERPIRYKELEQGEHLLSDRRVIRKDGTFFEIESNIKKVQEDKILIIARDVTNLREVQKQIQLSEAKFRGAFENSAIGMALMSLEGNYLRVNSQLCVIVGYSKEEMLDMAFQQITHADDVERDVQYLQQALKGKAESYRIEKRYIHKNGTPVWANVNISLVSDSDGSPLYFVSQVEEITDRKRVEREKDRARYLLNERIKELTTLYKVSQILHDEGRSIDIVMQNVASILPSGWQYPNICAARITLNGKTYDSDNFGPGVQKQMADFAAEGYQGAIEVVYLEAKPLEMEGPFFEEERTLINMIAEMVQIYFTRLHGEEALLKSEATLTATINNTEVLIWSVDKQFNLLMFNKPFSKYIKEFYGHEIAVGEKVVAKPNTHEETELQRWWEHNYLKALAGEIVTLEETRFGFDFQYSLSPIIEDNQITGVSVFADNVTERKAYDRELAEANKKIGELRLMALRSVMSPHFIFNVLNSIQYYITKNDRLNAIHYLSTFSKLIRSVLTHSVTNKIKLTDEVELLRNYVQLEMTRFENKFDFVLNIEKGMDAESIEIPSLLIQPYVENAILHGLYNKKEHGTLTITLRTEEEDMVVFEIEDNGIGREAAKKLREQNFPTHKSMGINLTQERLKLINQSNRSELEIEDLQNNGTPAGTRVRVKIKY
jgi:PAS domain S-box-containing protein